MPLFRNRRNAAAPETRSVDGPTLYLGSPELAEFFGLSGSDAGVRVTEDRALGLSAVYRAVSLLSGTTASLPIHGYRDKGGVRERVSTFLDNPGAELGMTQFEWTQTVVAHMTLHGETFLQHIFNGAGSIVALRPIHPMAVTVELDAEGRKLFKVKRDDDTTVTLTPAEMTHVPVLSLDGVRGVGPLQYARNVFGTALAGEQSAGRMYQNGLLIGGVASFPGADQEQVKEMVAGIKARAAGSKNAGDILGLNADVKFTPWTMNAEDAQFIESRQFSVDEIARLFGVPKVLLASDGASTWGAGIAELNRGLARYTLRNYTTPLEQALSALLPKPQFAEFEFAGLLQSSPEDEIRLLIEQVAAGLLTANEARAIRNLPPLPEAPAAPDPEVTE